MKCFAATVLELSDHVQVLVDFMLIPTRLLGHQEKLCIVVTVEVVRVSLARSLSMQTLDGFRG